MRTFVKKTECSEAAQRANANLIDHERYRCHYSANGMRCSAPGTITDSVMGPDAGKEDTRIWLCSTHHRLRGDSLGSQEALHAIAAGPGREGELYPCKPDIFEVTSYELE